MHGRKRPLDRRAALQVTVKKNERPRREKQTEDSKKPPCTLLGQKVARKEEKEGNSTCSPTGQIKIVAQPRIEKGEEK